MTPIPRRSLLCLPLSLLAVACQQLPQGTSEPAHRRPMTEPQTRALRDLGFTPVGDDWALNLAASVLFEFDSDQVRPLHRQQLERIGRTLAQVGLIGLRVEGHSDNVGDAEYNKRLSMRRAAAVAQVLSAAGLQRDHLPTQGFGSTKPIADNGTESGRAQNRRVVLIAPSI